MGDPGVIPHRTNQRVEAIHPEPSGYAEFAIRLGAFDNVPRETPHEHLRAGADTPESEKRLMLTMDSRETLPEHLLWQYAA